MPRNHLVDLIALAFFVALCLIIGALGGSVVATSVDTWYAELAKPSFTPPDEVFAPIWTAFYVLMAIAAWRVWRAADRDTRRGPLTLFALQLALTLGWTVVFFGLQKIGAALATIVVLDVGVVVTTLAFRPIDRWAGLLMVPYLAWVVFATVLTIAIWRLNPTA
jgi:tryptophan-rich sensory protein